MLPFNGQGFALPSHEAVLLVGSLFIWRIYLFTLAKNEAVVCSGYVFLKSVIFWLIWIRKKNSEALWSVAGQHTVVPIVMLFFRFCSEIWLRSSGCSYSHTWKLWGRARGAPVPVQGGCCCVQQGSGSLHWKLHLACHNHRVLVGHSSAGRAGLPWAASGHTVQL